MRSGSIDVLAVGGIGQCKTCGRLTPLCLLHHQVLNRETKNYPGFIIRNLSAQD